MFKSNDYDSDSSSDEEIGIYGRKIQQTKKEITKNHSETIYLETKSIEKHKYNDSNDSNNETDKENDSLDDESDSDSNDQPKYNHVKCKKKERENSPTPPSPPPPPSPTENILSKRKTNKQLKELEFINQTNLLKQNEEYFNENELNESDIENFITVRVLTKNGVKKWDYKKDERLKRIFEDLSKMENVNIENLVLMLHERKLTFDDTPNSINLSVGDLIDCGKSSKKVQERIKVVEDSEEEVNNDNQIIIKLQGEEGRKSRVKFLIYKDECFHSILKKYCQKREMKFENFMIEFDGEKIELNETPNDLDIEGGEIFDVTRNSKPTLEHVEENKKNYEFDDEVLCV